MAHKALAVAFTGLLLSTGLLIARDADARILRIDITRTESPTFEGQTFGDVGRYEKLVGRALGELDPRDPRNQAIVDLDRAPRNARGFVEYTADVLILRPIDPAKRTGRLFYEINNRGAVRSLGLMNDVGAISNDPTSKNDAGNGFLMRRGYTILVSGWDVTVAPGGGRLTLTVPIARHADGSPIIGPAMEEFVIDNNTTSTVSLTYPAATLTRIVAVLTVRTRFSAARVPVTSGEYENDRAVRLLTPGTAFKQLWLYSFVYQAKDPLVAGIAFAATRDLAVEMRRRGEAAFV